MLGDLYL